MSIKLKSKDDKEFIVEKSVAAQSILLKHLIEDIQIDDNDETIPVTCMSSILTKIIEYWKYHKDIPVTEISSVDDICEWDREFCKVDQNVLFELVLAANYLDIQPLLQLCCVTIASMIKGKSPEQIRSHFNIVNDFTPEEEETIRRENVWVN